MAAHSLHNVLKGLVVARIDEMNELCAGVPADARNMKTLLEHMNGKSTFVFERGDDQPKIIMQVSPGNRKSKHILVSLMGPKEPFTFIRFDGTTLPLTDRPDITSKRFDFTEDGLLDAITTAKKWLGKLSNEGTCPDCRNAAGERPSKRLKADNMPKCCECIIKTAVGF